PSPDAATAQAERGPPPRRGRGSSLESRLSRPATTALSDHTPPRDDVVALARGLALLRLVSESAQPMSNRELSDATGIPKATVSRLAATLVNAGFLRQLTDSERFSLGGGLLQISSTYLRNFDLPS